MCSASSLSLKRNNNFQEVRYYETWSERVRIPGFRSGAGHHWCNGIGDCDRTERCGHGWPQIQQLCDEAIANHTASVCINTCYVKQAVEYMAGRIPVCCVVGFPLGAMDTASKAFEAKTAIENGAAEVDMVINIGRLKNKEYDAVREDIRAVKQAVGDKILKVIIETCLLTEEEKEKMCDIVCEAGADYIKTSTGFSTAGANFHDVELMVKGVRGRCKVKAAGGISTVEDMETFLALGADRLGTSRAVKILNGEQAKGY